jgi:hypothetical protein
VTLGQAAHSFARNWRLSYAAAHSSKLEPRRHPLPFEASSSAARFSRRWGKSHRRRDAPERQTAAIIVVKRT